MGQNNSVLVPSLYLHPPVFTVLPGPESSEAARELGGGGVLRGVAGGGGKGNETRRRSNGSKGKTRHKGRNKKNKRRRRKMIRQSSCSSGEADYACMAAALKGMLYFN